MKFEQTIIYGENKPNKMNRGLALTASGPSPLIRNETKF